MSRAVSSPAKGGRSSIAEELMINREAAAYWIPAFAGMTAGLPQTRLACACERSEAKRSSFELRASHHDGLLRCARNAVETVWRWPRMGPPVRAEDLGTDSSR